MNDCCYKSSIVIDTRQRQNGRYRYRSRKCQICGHRFSTYEFIIPGNLQNRKLTLVNILYEAFGKEVEKEFKKRLTENIMKSIQETLETYHFV